MGINCGTYFVEKKKNSCVLVEKKLRKKSWKTQKQMGENIKRFKEIGWESMDLNYVPQDRSKWQPLLNTVMQLPLRKNAANFLTQKLLVSQEGFCPLELVYWIIFFGFQTLKIGNYRSFRKSVSNYQYSLCNNPKEHSSQLVSFSFIP